MATKNIYLQYYYASNKLYFKLRKKNKKKIYFNVRLRKYHLNLFICKNSLYATVLS